MSSNSSNGSMSPPAILSNDATSRRRSNSHTGEAGVSLLAAARARGARQAGIPAQAGPDSPPNTLAASPVLAAVQRARAESIENPMDESERRNRELAVRQLRALRTLRSTSSPNKVHPK